MMRKILIIILVIMWSSNLIATVKLEDKIRSGEISTSDIIVPYHPRLWAQGEAEWNYQNFGTTAWRIVHGSLMDGQSLANDQEKFEFFYCASIADDPECYGVTDGGTFGRRFLWTILAGHARRYGWENQLPSSLLPWSSATYNPKHTDDEYYADARAKLLGLANISLYYEWPYFICIYGAVGYDWLINLKYNNGNPVLSDNDKTTIQQLLITNADYIKQLGGGDGELFAATDIANYVYSVVGLALYEPSRINDPSYEPINLKAKQYLDDFDTYWVGKILPALNEQGGDGGWHGGFEKITQFMDPYYSDDTVLIWHIAPILFAHYTATGAPIEESIFSTGVIKYGAEFQNFMIRPNNNYYPPIAGDDSRMPWTAPMRMYSRRRFSSDPEQQKIGELGAWIRGVKSPSWFVNAGSYDFFDQNMFEEKWINPRSPEELGYSTTRHFKQLGWVFMRSGFTNPNDFALLFISQNYHWSKLNPYSQNSITLDYKEELIQGYNNTIQLDYEGQRKINSYPTIADGVEAYAPGSEYDVGPGIISFVTNSQYDAVIGDATNAYNPNKLYLFIRSLVWLKSSNTIIIFDRVITKKQNIKKTWVIDPGAIPQKKDDKLVKIVNGNGALWIKRLLPLEATEVKRENEYAITATQPVKEVIFLNVLQAADALMSELSTQILADDAQLIEESSKLGATIGNLKVMFDMNGKVSFALHKFNNKW